MQSLPRRCHIMSSTRHLWRCMKNIANYIVFQGVTFYLVTNQTMTTCIMLNMILYITTISNK